MQQRRPRTAARSRDIDGIAVVGGGGGQQPRRRRQITVLLPPASSAKASNEHALPVQTPGETPLRETAGYETDSQPDGPKRMSVPIYRHNHTRRLVKRDSTMQGFEKTPRQDSPRLSANVHCPFLSDNVSSSVGQRGAVEESCRSPPRAKEKVAGRARPVKRRKSTVVPRAVARRYTYGIYALYWGTRLLGRCFCVVAVNAALPPSAVEDNDDARKKKIDCDGLGGVQSDGRGGLHRGKRNHRIGGASASLPAKPWDR
ncbi:hypothetical protein MRX96_007398 [Rhipicephalus microplus]